MVVHGSEPLSGDDVVTVTDPADCKGGFHFGSIDLGQRGYFNGAALFGGTTGCPTATTTGCSAIHWDGRALTITLGAGTAVQPTQPAPSIAVYTPAGALGLPSPISSVSEEQF